MFNNYTSNFIEVPSFDLILTKYTLLFASFKCLQCFLLIVHVFKNLSQSKLSVRNPCHVMNKLLGTSNEQLIRLDVHLA